MEITILLYHRWHTSVNRERNILKISQSAKWQTREETGTESAVHLTLVTMNGVKRNENSSIVQSEVTADDFFKE